MPYEKLAFERRRQLLGILAAVSAGAMSGCSLIAPRDARPVCPKSSDVSFPDGPLTIDAHCHVFNGTDLQVKEFFSKVAIRQSGALGIGARVLGSILQNMAWGSAPTGEDELRELRKLGDALRTCTESEHRAEIAGLRQSAYSIARRQLQMAARQSREFESLKARRRLSITEFDLLDDETAAKIDALDLIESLPVDVSAYRAMQESAKLSPSTVKGRSVQGLIAFVLQNFQYRYVSVHDYLKTYNQKGTRVVDLMLPSMVDYDFWLAEGESTPTNLSVQVEVMRQIAILTGGRVHSFVPFDPLRQVAFDLKHSKTDSQSLVEDAVQKSGCIGVKLYPPMGFAAMGNSGLRKDDGSLFWARDWLPAWTRRADLGQRLDEAILRVLKWCETHEVPVMAHTGISNGVTQDFEELAGSKYWQLALKEVPNLRVNFGHFGATSIVEDGMRKAREFTALMSAALGSPGSRAFADAGYFVEVLNKQPELLADLKQLYQNTLPPGQAPLAARFMYGTDWEMTLTEGSIDAYMADFVRLFAELEGHPIMVEQGMANLSNRFFGGNAADWAGLRRGDQTRARLDSFYAKHAVGMPDWTTKLR